ncbi:MAG: hypothetical protein K2I10_02085 [Lachnospiraceae bacterium]|nr:hypothetical protein [Lachnospiraceae bacterium]
MNSFETDLSRAFTGVNFIAGFLIECMILYRFGFDSELFQISVPVLASFPYSTAWINDYQSGFLKEYLPRCGKKAYILGKFLSCGISGGSLISTACFFYLHTKGGEEETLNLLLVFLSGMLWAVVAALLAAASDSRYVAYGGSFVLYYVLIIIYERHFKTLYCLYPVEWFAPKHLWVFNDMGISLMCGGFVWICGIAYYGILEYRIEML